MKTLADAPRYRSHKVVRALEIKQINWRANQPPGGWTIVPTDPGFEEIAVEVAFTLRYMPVAGDFMVVYDDGYQSASPREPFLAGYFRVDDSDNSGGQAMIDTVTARKPAPTERDLELRRWAVEQAIAALNGWPVKDLMTRAAEIEAYVLNGASATKTSAGSIGSTSDGSTGGPVMQSGSYVVR